MRVFSIAKGFHYLAKRAYPDLSQKELDRLRAIRLRSALGYLRLLTTAPMLTLRASEM